MPLCVSVSIRAAWSRVPIAAANGCRSVLLGLSSTVLISSSLPFAAVLPAVAARNVRFVTHSGIQASAGGWRGPLVRAVARDEHGARHGRSACRRRVLEIDQ